MPPRRLALPVAAAAALALAACGSSAASAAHPAPTGVTGAATAGGATPVGTGSTSSATATTATTTTATPTTTAAPATATLPDGSMTIFPGHRVVAYYGTPTMSIKRDVLDRLSPAAAAAKVSAAAKPFATSGRPVLPAFEVIAAIAQGSPGADGDYSGDATPQQLQTYLDEATKDKMLVILDIQPGTGSFLPDVKKYEKELLQPNVSLALDSEWHLQKGQVPGQVFGSEDGADVDKVASYLSDLVATHHLPQKLLVVHTFTQTMYVDRGAVHLHPGVAVVVHLDGFGGTPNKISKYEQLHTSTPGQFNGFKLFYQDDTSLMTPKAVLALKPAPDLITYQ